jgi:predicted nucleic acid-binding Zn ribbon protein
MGKFDKKEKCEYCEEKMEAVYRNKRFCSPKCRVYFNREKEKPKETPKPIIKKEPSKGDLLKLIRDGKI